ncbi:MAG: hypothetical protein O3C10_01120 [Chloroflexi bacterium]|nr:hypothetical protein [Chloroflexota bacterium]
MDVVVDEERRGPSVKVDKYTITPVSRVQIHADRLGTFIACVGSKTPSGLIVNSGGREWHIAVPAAAVGPGD